MVQILYLLIIYPLYQIIEFCYTLSEGILRSPGLAIAGVSLAVSFLCLPLYVIAERWQETERQTQARLKPGIDRIKKAFKGDEQYMILSTFYRQNHYHPMMALRSSISLLIQIPFFIAAYQFLSKLPALQGRSFFFIRDLGAQDALFHIGSFPVNVLPVAMTVINIIAGAIYTKGHPLKEKLQIYIMAFFFLVFLYTSPSGLVFYWTLNNLFSLVKNVFYKLKKPLRALYFCLLAGVILADIYLIFFHDGFIYRRLSVVAALCVIPLAPLFVRLATWLLNTKLSAFADDDRQRNLIFYTSSAALAVLLGFALPSYVISSSPMEFSFIDDYASPFYFLRYAFFQSAGLFLVWGAAIYNLFGKRIKTLMSVGFSALLLCALVNAFAFGGDYGTISTILTFTNAGGISPSKLFALGNLLCCGVVIALLLALLILKKPKVVTFICSITLIASLGICVINSMPISRGYKEAKELKATGNQADSLKPIFNLSKTEKNVLVIMEDRALGTTFPYILEENPGLKNQFEGFTFYPNTASFAVFTLYGAPPIYGGYEYTPEAMNRRDSEALVDKHNEACRMMPVLFDQHGFTSTVTDISWANYVWIPDLRIFDDYPQIKKAPTIRVYTDYWLKNHPDVKGFMPQSFYLKRNFFWFSTFKIMPSILRETIYDEGHWWQAGNKDNFIQDFLNSYAVLDYLPELTDTSAEGPTFTLLVNEATHEPVLTGYPNYDLSSDAIGPGPLDDDPHFNSNSSAFYRLGEYMEYLKQAGVYDNTRIIIVADHGGTCKYDEITGNSGWTSNNPLLLYKDFGAQGELAVDETFMTNADTPLLATQGLIENAANPFTGKLLTESVNKDKVYSAYGAWNPDGQHKNTFKVTAWSSVHDRVNDSSCWAHEIPDGMTEEK